MLHSHDSKKGKVTPLDILGSLQRRAEEMAEALAEGGSQLLGNPSSRGV